MDIDLTFVRFANEKAERTKREKLAKEYIRKCKIRDFLCTALNVMGIISGIAFIIGLLILNYAITGVPV